MTNKIKENSHQAISWFLNGNSMNQKGMTLYIWGYEREEPTTKNTLPSKTLLKIWWRNQKLSRLAKVKRIQHHQTSSTAYAKGTSLDRKHKRKKRPTENKPKTIKKKVTRSHININGLKQMKTCASMHSTYHSTLLDSPRLYVIVLYC